AAAGTFMIETNPAHTLHAKGFAIVAGELEPSNLTDPIRWARVKRSGLALRRLLNLAEKLQGPRRVKTGFRVKFLERGQHIMRAVYVDVHCREPILKTLGNEALRRQVITLVEFMTADDIEDTRVTLQAAGMQLKPVEQVTDARKSALRIFEGDASDDAVDLVAQ